MLPSEFPLSQAEPGWRELRNRLMNSAACVIGQLKARGRSCNTEVFTCEVAEHAGIALPSQREYNLFVMWAEKARQMAEYEAERAQANGGQFGLFS